MNETHLTIILRRSIEETRRDLKLPYVGATKYSSKHENLILCLVGKVLLCFYYNFGFASYFRCKYQN